MNCKGIQFDLICFIFSYNICLSLYQFLKIKNNQIQKLRDIKQIFLVSLISRN